MNRVVCGQVGKEPNRDCQLYCRMHKKCGAFEYWLSCQKQLKENREYVIVCNEHRGNWSGCLLFWGERTPDDRERSFSGYTSDLDNCEIYTKSELENSGYNFPFYTKGDDWRKYEDFAIKIDQFDELGLRAAKVVYVP